MRSLLEPLVFVNIPKYGFFFLFHTHNTAVFSIRVLQQPRGRANNTTRVRSKRHGGLSTLSFNDDHYSAAPTSRFSQKQHIIPIFRKRTSVHSCVPEAQIL